MSSIQRTYTFADGTTFIQSQAEVEISNIVKTWNNHDQGISSWTSLKVSGKSLFSDGTVGTPSIGFAADTNTGFYRIGADEIGVTCGGAVQADISSAGIDLNYSGTAFFKIRSTGTSLKGTNTNDNAATGWVGEYLVTSNGSVTNFPTSNQYGDAGSLSLTAGDWDLTFQLYGDIGTATWSRITAGISTTSGNVSPGGAGDNSLDSLWANSALTPLDTCLTIANYRALINSTTTYYAKVLSTYTAGTPRYIFRFSARRIR